MVALLGDRAISGQIDRLVVLPDRVLIVDYKTLRPPPADPESVPPAYLRQLAAYRAAVQAIYPGHAVDAAIAVDRRAAADADPGHVARLVKGDGRIPARYRRGRDRLTLLRTLP